MRGVDISHIACRALGSHITQEDRGSASRYIVDLLVKQVAPNAEKRGMMSSQTRNFRDPSTVILDIDLDIRCFAVGRWSSRRLPDTFFRQTRWRRLWSLHGETHEGNLVRSGYGATVWTTN